MSAAPAGSGRQDGGGARRLIAQGLDAAIVLSGVLALALTLAGAMAPTLSADIDPAAVSSDGGHAYTFSPRFSVRWPFTVPSHPAVELTPDDVRVMEDGRAIGTLQPNHDMIRTQGAGLHNFWDGTLWFSSSDGSDPRDDGRGFSVVVRTRLSSVPAAVDRWSTGFFGVLALSRIGAAFIAIAAPILRRVVGRVRDPVRRFSDRIPLTFRWTYCLVCTLLLGVFAAQTLARPTPLIFQIDSFTYVQPGVLWDAGRSVAGVSSRDVGYPALTALALRLGGLGRLPLLQIFIVLAGLACILAVLFRAFRFLAKRLDALAGLSTIATSALSCAVAAGYLLLLASHDLFVIDIYSAMGEALHLLPSAATLLLFVVCWTARTPSRRLTCSIGAMAASYLSIMVKPHTLLTLALCIGGFVVIALRDYRGFRSPGVLAACVMSAVLVGVVHQGDVVVTPPDSDFGPKTILCNHLDVVLPAFRVSTPERARVAALMHEVLAAPSNWTLVGYDGDRCVYNAAMSESVAAAARSEGLSPAAWEGREFLHAVVARPVAYARDVLRQFRFYLTHPVEDIDSRQRSIMPDDVWANFAPFMGHIQMSRDDFLHEIGNWMPTAYPRLTAIGKTLLRGMATTFAPVTLGGTVLALIALLVLRGSADLRLEAVTLAIAAFTLAFVATTVLSHTFDVRRYLTDILPFSLLWWIVSSVYLVHALALWGALAVRQRHLAPMSLKASGR
ncbi:MAG: hypothetical protein ACRYGP_06680 [Janthinobacterium lividum]